MQVKTYLRHAYLSYLLRINNFHLHSNSSSNSNSHHACEWITKYSCPPTPSRHDREKTCILCSLFYFNSLMIFKRILSFNWRSAILFVTFFKTIFGLKCDCIVIQINTRIIVTMQHEVKLYSNNTYSSIFFY